PPPKHRRAEHDHRARPQSTAMPAQPATRAAALLAMATHRRRRHAPAQHFTTPDSHAAPSAVVTHPAGTARRRPSPLTGALHRIVIISTSTSVDKNVYDDPG